MSAAPRAQTPDIAKQAQRPEEAVHESEVDGSAAREGHAAVVGDDAAVARDAAVVREDSALAREEVRDEAAVAHEDAAVAGEAELDTEDAAAPLFAEGVAGTFRKRWDAIQAAFVDDPRRAVEQADALVSETIRQLTDTFARERSKLEQQFNRSHQEGAQSHEASTENLRHTLRHYRSFFTRLLAV